MQRKAATFKAGPNSVIQKKAFQPQASTRPLTGMSSLLRILTVSIILPSCRFHVKELIIPKIKYLSVLLFFSIRNFLGQKYIIMGNIITVVD